MKNAVIFDRHGESESARTIRERMINELMAKWNKIEYMLERRHEQDEYGYTWAEQAEEYYIEAAVEKAVSNMLPGDNNEKLVIEETTKNAKAYWKEEMQKPLIEQRLLEEQIAFLGARFARPYEHWNEEEKYVEYLETRYDNQY